MAFLLITQIMNIKFRKEIVQCALAVFVLAVAIILGLQKEVTSHNFDKLIGREREIEEILSHFTSSDVNVVTLWGLPGMGKSLIAHHVGTEMRRLGYNVYSITVEDYEDVASLTDKIISDHRASSLEQWAKHAKPNTLLILDNVHGIHWANNESIRSIQKYFIDVLIADTTNLKILVTSQHSFESWHEGTSHYIGPLSLRDCISYIQYLDAYTSYNQSLYICKAGGCVPLAVRLMVSSFFPLTEKKWQKVSEVITKFPNILPLSKRIVRAIEVAFSMLPRECLYSSLLLSKFEKYFTVDLAKKLITSEIFDLCFRELSTRSFLLQYTVSETQSYSFHSAVGQYLRDAYSCTDAFEEFWQNYFYISSPINFLQLGYISWKSLFPEFFNLPLYDSLVPVYVHETDFKCFSDLLQANNKHSYHLASFLVTDSFLTVDTASGIPRFLLGIMNYPAHYNKLIQLAVKLLNTSIRSEEIPPVSDIHVFGLIAAFFNLFYNQEHLNYENKTQIMDDLMRCENKINQLTINIKDYTLHRRAIATRIMIMRSYFHRYVDDQCHEMQNEHDICQNRWRYRLLTLPYYLGEREDHEDLLKGLLHYAVMEDNEAVSYLNLSLKYQCCFKELQNGIAYIILYDIYSRKNSTMGMQFTLNSIQEIYGEATSTDYFSAAYGYIVIPFLWSANETVPSARILCDKWIKSYCDDTRSCNCDPYSLHKHHTTERILSSSFCPMPFDYSSCVKADTTSCNDEEPISRSPHKVYISHLEIRGTAT